MTNHMGRDAGPGQVTIPYEESLERTVAVLEGFLPNLRTQTWWTVRSSWG